MKLAVIPPVKYLNTFSTDYHMVLAQYCYKYPEYLAYYKERQAAGNFIILDNGAAELKEASDTTKLLQLALELKPNLVVAPDVIYDRHRTMERTITFLLDYKHLLSEAGIQVLAIPQGRNKIEWIECYAHFNNDPRIDWLGLSMFYTPIFESRLNMLNAVAHSITKPCHLFGMWKDPFTLPDESKYSFVRGVDTAKPVEYALEGLKLDFWQLHRHIDDDWYFGLDNMTDEQVVLAHQNIEQLKVLASGSH